MNTVNLIGNLTRDPQVRETSSDTTVVSMRIAVNGRRKDRPGYFDVTVFGKLADVCAEYLEKGRKVAVSGRLDYQEWKNPNGDTRSKVEVIASEVDFLSAAPTGDDEEPQAEAPEADATPAQTAPKSNRRRKPAEDQEPVSA